jgi:hypothetical protein
MSDGYFGGIKKVSLGFFAPPPSNFWRLRGNITLLECIVLVWHWGRCGAGAILVAAFMAAGQIQSCPRTEPQSG